MKKKLLVFMSVLLMALTMNIPVHAAAAGTLSNPYTGKTPTVVTAQEYPFDEVSKVSLQILNVYSGAEANNIVKNENSYNAVPKSDEQWIIYRVVLKNLGKNTIRALDVLKDYTIFTELSCFSTASGKKIQTINSVATGGQGKLMSGKTTFDVTLKQNQQSEVYVTCLTKKSNGIPLLCIKTKASYGANREIVRQHAYFKYTAPVVTPTGIKLNYTDQKMYRGATLAMKATVTPTGASQSVAWSTGNANIATVDKNGVVTGKGSGSTYIYAKTANGIVAKAIVRVVIPPAQSVTLSKTAVAVDINGSYTATAKVNPTGAEQRVVWSSKDSTVAYVYQNGKIVGKKAGKTYVYAKTPNGKVEKILVTVRPDATTVKLNTYSASVAKGKTVQLKATVYPTGTSQGITWKSNNTKVVTVDKNGKVTATGKGTAYVTATTLNKKTVNCKIVVK